MKKLFWAIAMLVVVFSGVNFVSAQASAKLFAFKEIPSAKLDKSSLGSIRESEIGFDSLSLSGAETLEIPLFDGKTYLAKHFQTETRAADDYTWRGRISEGKFAGDVILTFRKGYVAGLIYAPLNQVYEIVPKFDKQILIELNQNLFPECAGAVLGDESKPKTENAIATTDSGDRIDVLVVYTTPVKNSLGGDAQAQALAQSAIDTTNTTYINSKIRQRVRLVNASETAIAETGSLGTELPVLRNDATVAALRDQYKADLVAMISNSSDNCGIGYLMGAANSQNGFTVTSRTCAVGNLSFPHELGHNMGSQHNPENGSGATYPYGYGHYVNGVFRTVMSYVDPCTSGCTRQPYFSNPEILFSGFPTGIDNARDNARSINNTADTIANYRYSGSNLLMTNFNGGEALPRLISRALTWSSDNITGNVRIDISRDESTNWQTLIANTPNDGTENVTVSGRATRRARLRIVSINNPIVSDSSVKNISIR
ncbi:MAG: M12 family metallo-peptidase [Actinomycetota bacterium]